MKSKFKSYGLVQRIESFIRFWFSAKPWYTVHSPYIFGLVKHIKKTPFDRQRYRPIENLRRSLKHNNTVLHFPDFGDSGKLKQRTVSNIAKQSAKNPIQCKVLSQIITYLNPSVGVELGTSLGISYAYLATASPNTTLITIEGAPQIAEQASTNLSELGLFGHIKVGQFDTILPEVLKELEVIDFAYVDGNHQEQQTINYFNQLVERLSANGCIIFDDIYWSEGMTNAWTKIQQDSRVSLSVDFYHFGLIFIRPGVEKQHFKLRL
jgi:predicted O-methyltransferase YrrM